MKFFFSTAFIIIYFFGICAMEHNSVEKNVENLLNLINGTAISLNHNDNLPTWFVFVGYVGRLETYVELNLIKNTDLKEKARTTVNVSNETVVYYLKKRENKEQKNAALIKRN